MTRRVLIILLLAAFAAAGIGFPMPATPHKAGEDFPCKYHACGCLNADMCRTNCCCFKPESGAPSEPESCCSTSCSDGETAAPKSRPGAVIQPLACKGVSLHWVAVAPTTPIHQRIECLRPTTLIGRVGIASSILPITPFLQPDTPPPRA